MDIFVVETFQYDWRDKKVTSQFLLVETRESAKQFVDEAIKEYLNTTQKATLVINEDDRYVYRISTPSVDGNNDYEFFIGYFQRHVHSPSDTNELLNTVKEIKSIKSPF